MTIVLILAIYDRQLLKKEPKLSVYKLTINGAIVCFIAEIFFQLTKEFVVIESTFKERVVDFGIGVIGITCFGAALSFFTAFQIKTKRTGRLMLFILVFLSILYLLKMVISRTSA